MEVTGSTGRFLFLHRLLPMKEKKIFQMTDNELSCTESSDTVVLRGQ